MLKNTDLVTLSSNKMKSLIGFLETSVLILEDNLERDLKALRELNQFKMAEGHSERATMTIDKHFHILMVIKGNTIPLEWFRDSIVSNALSAIK
jgi:hypothetical protein